MFNRTNISIKIENLIPHCRDVKTFGSLRCFDSDLELILNDIFLFDELYLCDPEQKNIIDVLSSPYDNIIGRIINLNNYTPSFIKKCQTLLWNDDIHNYDDITLINILNDIKCDTFLLIGFFSETKELKINKSIIRSTVDILYLLQKKFKYIDSKKLYDINDELCEYIFICKNGGKNG